VLLYRRMMLRIAEVLAKGARSLALVTGDSLGQVASQTLRNLIAVEAAARMPVFRPLIGTDKMEILATARKIGTYETSSEPFHDCCPVFMPRTPALYASAEELDEAESKLDIRALIAQGVRETSVERFHYRGGKVEVVPSKPRTAKADRERTAIA
jgi:tRNA uracil 4-sulfurtransferase